ncbi:zf-RVT domain-containing protein, partial [Cephalotus follicularis]
ILRKTEFRQGVLQVKYLGLPLITSRLTKHDCTPLIEKILARVNSWVTKTLSYAGRLQLIKSTLASMKVFWCSTFLLPVAVIKDCERILQRFLWGSSGTSRKHSLVKWSNVCLPWQEGGLGIKSLKACFWTLPPSGSLSWSWRQILLLRNTALTHLVYVCGKGDRFSLWYDPWFQGTSIYAIYGHRVIYDAGLATSELVHVVIENDKWCWPTTSLDLLDIQSRFQDIPITSSPDCIFWETVGHPFSTKQAWKSIRTTAPHVVWAKLVWHPSCISKHAFCLWLAIQGALKTLDKLSHRGILPSASCVFKCWDNENVDLLFFACPYT